MVIKTTPNSLSDLVEVLNYKAKLKKELIEKLAPIQHEIWAHWMEYLFSKCSEQEIFDNGRHFKTGNLVINKELVERWKRQIETPYSELSETEKQSDINQVLKFIDLVEPSRAV